MKNSEWDDWCDVCIKTAGREGMEMQGRMAVGFVNLEKAYDTYPREMVTATVRWVGVPESEAVVAMCENKRRVVVGSGLSE